MTAHSPVFENTGLTELKKAWKTYGAQMDTAELLALAEENFENGTHAVALFLADRILKEKNPADEARTRLRFIRAEAYFAFKFYRQAYPDYKFYVRQHGETEELRQKMNLCRKMIHTGNVGSVLFIAIFAMCTNIMYYALYQLQGEFPMGLNIHYIHISTAISGALLLGGLFYRYVIISRMK